MVFRGTFLRMEDTTILRMRNKLAKSMKRPAKNALPCELCDAVFTSMPELYTHNWSAHKHKIRISEAWHTCKACHKEFLLKKDMEAHFLETHAEKSYEDTKFTCATCEEVFHTAYKYSLHLYGHDRSKDYSCPICSFTTPRLKSIGTHIHAAHFKQYEHVCKHCGKVFNNPVNLMEHEEIHIDNSAEFVCVVCNRVFSENDKLTMHQVRYHRVLVKPKSMKVCEICGKSYVKKYTLELHMTNFHGKETAIKKPETNTLCSVCGKHFNHLNMHMRIHDNYKPYKCGHCEKSFAKRDCLVMHERVHTGERPYVCKTCGKSFNQRTSLRLHIRIHTGERPYKCHLCSRAFIVKAALNGHLKSCSG